MKEILYYLNINGIFITIKYINEIEYYSFMQGFTQLYKGFNYQKVHTADLLLFEEQGRKLDQNCVRLLTLYDKNYGRRSSHDCK